MSVSPQDELEEAWKALKINRGGKGKRAQLVGQVFGRLTVMSEAGSNRHGKAMWQCTCSCGKSKTTTGALLQSGRVRSCGCIRKEKALQAAARPPKKRRRLHPLIVAARRIARERATGVRDEEEE